MVKVYIIFLDIPYSGSEVYGVYDAEERADEICDALNGDSVLPPYYIEEWEVG